VNVKLLQTVFKKNTLHLCIFCIDLMLLKQCIIGIILFVRDYYKLSLCSMLCVLYGTSELTFIFYHRLLIIYKHTILCYVTI